MKIKVLLILILSVFYACSSDGSDPKSITIDHQNFSPSPNKGTEQNRKLTKTANSATETRTETYELVQRGQTSADDIIINLSVSYPNFGRVQGRHDYLRNDLKGFLILEGIRYEVHGGHLDVKYNGSNNYEFAMSLSTRENNSSSDFKGIHGRIKIKLKEFE